LPIRKINPSSYYLKGYLILADKSILYLTPALPIGGAEKFLVLLANSLEKEFISQTVISLSSDNKLQSEFTRSVKFTAYVLAGLILAHSRC
jgi:hypothetical protein